MSHGNFITAARAAIFKSIMHIIQRSQASHVHHTLADVASLERFEPSRLSIILGTVPDSPLPQIIVISCVVTELAGLDLFASLEVLP